MTLDRDSIIAAIKARVIEIASTLDTDASDLQPDDILPATGAIDSAGLLDLIAWFEATYAIQIATEEFTIDNLGSMDMMSTFLLKKKGLL
jgi:D-alanine--poly(phosphoribitol) ligase subunit 2